MNYKKLLPVFALVAAVSGAHAITYKWSFDSSTHVNGAQPGGGDLHYNPHGGAVKTIDAQFDTATNNLSYDILMDCAPGTTQCANGFWLAMSPGPNPKDHPGQLALFYFDASNSAPVLTAYGYNGQNGDNSWHDGSSLPGTQSPDFIKSSKTDTSWVNELFTEPLANCPRRFRFSINLDGINGHSPLYPSATDPWTGAAFGEKFGIWMHPVRGLQTTYNNQGALTQWNYSAAGWLDGSNMQTVPEPGTMLALGLGVAALARRRKNAK
jgi:hypothetical protein